VLHDPTEWIGIAMLMGVIFVAVIWIAARS
jgi:hypothetical protein